MNERVAVVIPAKDEVDRIATTIRACRAIPHVDLVLVVDDGSEDGTQHAARNAGAVVVRHSVNRGKASAMETGSSVVAMRDIEGRPARMLMFIDADMGESAVECAALVEPVFSGEIDLAIAALPPEEGSKGPVMAAKLARSAIVRATGWRPYQPLSGIRCITREAFNAALPLAHGWGVETGMTIDVLTAGFTVQEVPCNLRGRPIPRDLSGSIHRSTQYRDVLVAISSRRMRGVHAPKDVIVKVAATQKPGLPYTVNYAL